MRDTADSGRDGDGDGDGRLTRSVEDGLRVPPPQHAAVPAQPTTTAIAMLPVRARAASRSTPASTTPTILPLPLPRQHQRSTLAHAGAQQPRLLQVGSSGTRPLVPPAVAVAVAGLERPPQPPQQQLQQIRMRTAAAVRATSAITLATQKTKIRL